MIKLLTNKVKIKVRSSHLKIFSLNKLFLRQLNNLTKLQKVLHLKKICSKFKWTKTIIKIKVSNQVHIKLMVSKQIFKIMNPVEWIWILDFQRDQFVSEKNLMRKIKTRTKCIQTVKCHQRVKWMSLIAN
jgi:hypothetical protein